MTKVLYFPPAYVSQQPILLDLTDTAAAALVSSGAGAYPVPTFFDQVLGIPKPSVLPLSVTAPDSMPVGTVGSGPIFTPTITGGTPPYFMTVAGGALAPGRSILGLNIVGNYTTAGDFSYVLRVTDSAGAAALLSVNVSVGGGTGLLDDPVMYQIGASLEGQGLRGSADPVAYGFTAQTPLVWANHLAPKRLFTIQTGKHPTEPFYYRPTSYATGGAGFTSVPNPGWSVNDQVDLAIAHAQTLPNGRQKAVWYNPGRNDISSSTTFIPKVLAHVDRLLAVFDLVIVPGMWKRHFDAGDGWQKGGSARASCDAINAQLPALLAERGSKVIYVPLQDIMSDGTADQNPRLDYLCDGTTHYSNLGAQACGKPVYDAIKSRFLGHVDSGNLITLTGETGTLSNGVTGKAATGAVVTKDPTVSVVASIPAPGSVGLALTTAVTQATVAEGLTYNAPPVTLTSAGNYRARMHVRIEPTAARVVVGGGLLETTSGVTPQRALGMFACRANAFAAINIASTASASIDTLDASKGLDLYIDTPDMAVGANATVVPYVTIAADQGAVLTINMVASEWSVVRGADSLPTFGFRYAGITKPEGNAGTTTVYGFEVIRSTGVGTVTIPYTINPGTADAADFLNGVLPANGSVTFAEGETSKLINITVVGDNVEESADTFQINLGTPAGYVSNGSIVGTGIIVNDDGLQTFAYRENWTEATAVSPTVHTSDSGHTYAKVGNADMVISPGNNRARWNGGTGYMRCSYAPASPNYDLKVKVRCVHLRAAGMALRMASDGGCVTVGYSANGASWACNDRRSDNQLTGYTGGTAVTIELLRWYDMTIKVRGNTFEQWIDDAQVSPTHTFRTNYGGNIGFANVTSYSSNPTEGWEYGPVGVIEYAG